MEYNRYLLQRGSSLCTGGWANSSVLLVTPTHLTFSPEEQSSRYFPSSFWSGKYIERCLRYSDTLDTSVSLKLVNKYRINREALRNAVSCLPACPWMHTPVQVKSCSACNSGKYVVKCTDLQSFVAFKKFKRPTPTSSRNLWELNKGRVLGVC